MQKHANKDQTRQSSRSSGVLRKMLKIMVILGVVLFGLGYVVTQVTPMPFVFLFRQLVGTMEIQGTLGPYADQITDVSETEIIPIPVEGAPDAGLTLYRPAEESETPRPIVLLIHGGGWIIGNAKHLSQFGKLLASEGYVVANLDYSLAPERPYPTPILQSVAAINYLTSHAEDYDADPTRFFIAGNSAGAQLASQLGALVTNPTFESAMGLEVALPAEHLRGLVLYSGPYNFDTVEATNFPGWRMYAWSYTGQRDYEIYARLDELSTVKHVTANYPPTYLTTGDADPLAPQTYELDAILQSLGVSVQTRYWTDEGLNHDYQFELDTEAGQIVLEDTLQFLSDHAQP